MRRSTVQLVHSVPDGSSHIDWLLATDADGVSPLVTFRIGQRVDELPAGAELAAERLADHRPRYLTFEGDIGGGRGQVRRVASGSISRWAETGEGGWEIDVAWSTALMQRIRIEPRASDRWRVVVVDQGCSVAVDQTHT